MISFDRFERNLPVLLDELAAPRLPDYADDLFARTAATRQRAGWTFLERWFPMSSFAARFATTPRIPWRLAALVALLATAAVITALIAGALVQRPSNLGPGRNGEIILVTKAGEVVAADPVTGTTRHLVSAGGAANTRPIMSPDGTKFLLLRPSAAGSQNIFVVDLQGNETLITPDALSAWHYVGWSPLGDRIVLRDEGGRLLILDALQAAPPFSLSQGLGLGDISVGSGSNYKSADAFRPPNGDEILFAAHGGKELMAIRPDGTGLRTIVDAPGAGLGLELGEAQWSPDGSQIVFSMRADEEAPVWVYLVNADGSNLRSLSTAGDHLGPQWSPDGSSVAFQYWTPPPRGRDWVAHPIGIVEVATGEVRDVGPVSIDGYLRWEWSPDGSSILEAPRDGVGGVVIVNATTGHTTSTPWSVDQPVSWQRLPLE